MATEDSRLDLPVSSFDNRIHVGGPQDTNPRYNADANYLMYEGMIVSGTGQTKGKVVRMDGSSITNLPYGICKRRENSGVRVNEPLLLNEPLKVFPIGGGAKVYVPIAVAAGPVPLDDGDIIIAEKSGTYPGMGQKLTSALITGSTSYPKLLQKIGIVQFPDDMTNGATKVRWSKLVI